MIRRFFDYEINQILRRQKNGTFSFSASKTKLYFVVFLGILNFILGTFLLFKFVFLKNLELKISEKKENFFVKKSGEYKVYLEYKNVYQSHTTYSKSISYDQFKGETPLNLDICSPFATSNGKIIYPCGKIAESFSQIKLLIDGTEISDEGITWGNETDFIKPTKYKVEEITPPLSWNKNTDLKNLNKNRRFQNWVDLAAFSSFRKLHGKVYLKKGVHNFVAESPSKYKDTKVVLSETTAFGVRNLFLAFSLIFWGAVMFFIGGFALKYCDFSVGEL